MKRSVFVCLLCFLYSLSFANVGKINGYVYDAKSGAPLPGANVQLDGTFIGASSSMSGFFEITSVPPGEYLLKASYIGYKAVQLNIRVQVERSFSLDIKLEPTPLLGEQIVVTGSRQPENLASAAESINILSKDDISRRNSLRIDEALISVPGTTIVGENINIRGGSGYNRLGGHRVLVMLDEVPIMTSDMGESNWNILPVTEVEHIEVLKGASSSLYGSGALSGVVNIKTKKPTSGHSFGFRHTTGVYDDPSVPQWKWSNDLLYFNKTDVSYSKSFGSVGLRCAVSHHQSTSDRQNGQFERWYFTGKISTQLSGSSTLTLFSTYSTEDRGVFLRWQEQDQALVCHEDENGKNVQINGYVGYAVFNKLFSPSFSMKIRASYNQQLVGLPFDLSSFFTPAMGLSGEMQFNWKAHKNHSVSFGMDYKYDEMETTFYGMQKANSFAPYLQEIWHLSNLLQLNAGIRWDNYILVGDSLETQLSPKIGFSYQPFVGTILHGSIGRAFRAATVVERFLEINAGIKVIPNPGLIPERSTLIDFGIRQNVSDLFYVELSAFNNTYFNLIEPNFKQFFEEIQFKNYPTAYIRGVESEFRFSMWKDRLRLNATATWMDHKETSTDEPLVYRPNLIANLSPSLWLGPMGLECDFRYMNRLKKVALFALDERVPTKILDCRLIYDWKNIRLQLLVRNALNYNYTVSERVLGEIRNVAFSISGNF